MYKRQGLSEQQASDAAPRSQLADNAGSRETAPTELLEERKQAGYTSEVAGAQTTCTRKHMTTWVQERWEDTGGKRTRPQLLPRWDPNARMDSAPQSPTERNTNKM